MYKTSLTTVLASVICVSVFLVANFISTKACACISIADNQEHAKKEIEALLAISALYKKSERTFAPNIAELLKYQKESGAYHSGVVPRDVVDPWGNPYAYKIRNGIFGESVSITSYGNDGVRGGWLKNSDISG